MWRYLATLFVLLLAGCTTGPTLKKEVEVMQRQLDQHWTRGAYRCSPEALAHAETELVFARTELAQGDPVRAARHRRRAQTALVNIQEAMELCPALGPDRDGDGISDRDDQCPDAPEDFDGRDDADGCPDSEDKDGDTVLDEDDGCPDVPGAVDNQGCPYGDADEDGLADDADQCPKAAEDVDEFEDTDGCPDPDNDQDGVPDDQDRCPLDPETVNAFEDDDGCPDVKTELVRVNRETHKIEIKQKVYFATGKTRIRARSLAMLSEVAAVLKASPGMTVVVEGHTDSVGSTSTNLKLSQRRADAVRVFLVEQGIDPGRLTAIGFGAEKPIDSNRTRRGRERNRRVEFTITAE